MQTDPPREVGPVDHDAEHAPELDLLRARRSALDALFAYREAHDAAGLAEVFKTLGERVPAHWLVTGLLSVANQLVEYLAASQGVEGRDVLRAFASLEEASAGLDDEEDDEDGDDEEDVAGA